MISHNHKFIFTHIPRTGGTSIDSVLKKFCEPNQRIHNDIITDLKSCSNDYFKFAFVRNPWDLVVSGYHYIWYSDAMVWWRVGVRSKPLSFNDWIRSKYFRRPPGWEKIRCYRGDQLCWITDYDGNIIADFIGRFENLQGDFDIVCDKIKIPCQKLPHKNKTHHKHYSEYYDDETREIIAKKFKKDIDFFGYEFEKLNNIPQHG
jgi:hypothetical protein